VEKKSKNSRRISLGKSCEEPVESDLPSASDYSDVETPHGSPDPELISVMSKTSGMHADTNAFSKSVKVRLGKRKAERSESPEIEILSHKQVLQPRIKGEADIPTPSLLRTESSPSCSPPPTLSRKKKATDFSEEEVKRKRKSKKAKKSKRLGKKKKKKREKTEKTESPREDEGEQSSYLSEGQDDQDILQQLEEAINS